MNERRSPRDTARQFLDRHDLPGDWRVLFDRIEATFVADSFRAGAAFVGEIAHLADEVDHHPDVDLRYPGAVHIVLVTHASGGLTRLDAQLAEAISAAAASAALRSEPTAAIRVGVELPGGPDAACAAFWAALLGYRPVPPIDQDIPADGARRLVDPRRISAPLALSSAHTAGHGGGPRLSVEVPADGAEARVAAALGAGGTVLDGGSAPARWLLADPAGTQVVLCTIAGAAQ